MRNFILLFSIGFLICLSSCRSDFEFERSVGGLRFSRDTVYLDTVFTNIGSSTYTLKVYNRSDKDISIPTIQLGKGLDSKYRITVDGMTGENNRIFHNVEMLAKDSMYIFIETTADVAEADPTTFLYTDQILFGEAGNFQDVDLVTLIQDAVFLYPQRFDDGTTETLPFGEEQIYGFFLDHDDHGDEFTFTNEKPYVIYGYAGVPSGETLTVQAGARVHFHDASGILVGNGGAINVEGAASATEALEGEVIFEGDRLEPDFSDVPGQWGTIWLTPGSTGNFSHATIKNGSIGLYIQANSGTVAVNDCQIYDNSIYGIYAQTANVSGRNTVINSAGEATLACTLGGSYDFTHCTFNNNWQSSSQVAVFINNRLLGPNNQEIQGYDLNAATFRNCIIYGSNQVEMLLQRSEDESFAFEYFFDSCLLRFSNTALESNELYQFSTNTDHYAGLVRNENPRFWNINQNNLRIEPDSGAFGIANPAFVFSPDLDGNPRTTNDAGAYQSSEVPES